MNVVTATEVILYGLSFLTALALVMYVTPLTINVALAFKVQDAPDGRLKKHTRATPYLGGLAVAAAFIITFSLLSNEDTANYKAMGILAAGLMMMLLGLYDDLSNLRPSVKFLGQVLAAVVLYKAQVRIELAALSDTANLLVTILWVTGITNAFNIIDVMDGLASGTACVAALFLFVISLLTIGDGDPAMVVPFMALILAGALTGFLRFNFAPARIFLGDTGSLFIGFMMGALSMLVSYTGGNRLALFTPMVLLAIPIFDTLFVAWHRARKGIPFFRGSPDHFALRLTNAGLSVRRTALRTYGVGVLLGLASLLLVFGPEWLGPFVLGGVGLGGVVAFVRLSRLPPPGRTGKAA